ncbi:hypothetical protein GEV33_010719 [Tenebrio molitor]|uniref:Gustatory receptor n=1 Tax=Tenebrio molitor TaxID=7067 RepID=A0A8J6HDH8_TENMO|nr:hypothetical protein GEV33_010719 [Tenebrio molitor]
MIVFVFYIWIKIIGGARLFKMHTLEFLQAYSQSFYNVLAFVILPMILSRYKYQYFLLNQHFAPTRKQLSKVVLLKIKRNLLVLREVVDLFCNIFGWTILLSGIWSVAYTVKMLSRIELILIRQRRRRDYFTAWHYTPSHPSWFSSNFKNVLEPIYKNVQGLPSKNPRRGGAKAITRGNEGQKGEVHGCSQCKLTGRRSEVHEGPLETIRPSTTAPNRQADQELHYDRFQTERFCGSRSRQVLPVQVVPGLTGRAELFIHGFTVSAESDLVSIELSASTTVFCDAQWAEIPKTWSQRDNNLTSVGNLPLDNPRPPAFAGLGQNLPLCATYMWSPQQIRCRFALSTPLLQKMICAPLLNVPEFTATRYFYIDRTAIFNILNSITTFLVVLIQFKSLDSVVPQRTQIRGDGTADRTLMETERRHTLPIQLVIVMIVKREKWFQMIDSLKKAEYAMRPKRYISTMSRYNHQRLEMRLTSKPQFLKYLKKFKRNICLLKKAVHVFNGGSILLNVDHNSSTFCAARFFTFTRSTIFHILNSLMSLILVLIQVQ